MKYNVTGAEASLYIDTETAQELHQKLAEGEEVYVIVKGKLDVNSLSMAHPNSRIDVRSANGHIDVVGRIDVAGERDDRVSHGIGSTQPIEQPNPPATDSRQTNFDPNENQEPPADRDPVA